mmetsp:Transcript_5302/g.18739  ORF Transcript_5302/g.18739 Transcript_5302/m.18739 type:complete len:171 (+) Transcript_5302:1-513(+)
MDGYQDAVATFKKNFIYKHIAETEESEKTMAVWLRSLNERNFKFTQWESSMARKGQPKRSLSKREQVSAVDEQGVGEKNKEDRTKEAPGHANQAAYQNGTAEQDSTPPSEAAIQGLDTTTCPLDCSGAMAATACIPDSFEGALEKQGEQFELDAGKQSEVPPIHPEAAIE